MLLSSKHYHCLQLLALFTGAHILFHSTAFGAPTVSVSKSFADEQLTVTLSGTEFPELKTITFECSFDPQYITIRDAIVGAPLPKTALSVAVNDVDSSVTLTVQATSTIQVENDKQLLVLQIPLQNEENNMSFTITKVTLIDKNDTSIDAAINQLATVVPSTHYRYQAIAQHTLSNLRFQLNGRRYGTGHRMPVSGVYIQRGKTPSRSVVFR